MAGDARKVSAVRFERINPDDTVLDTKEVTRLVPKIMKRKWSSSGDSVRGDDEEEVMVREEDESFPNNNHNVVTEHVENYHHENRQ